VAHPPQRAGRAAFWDAPSMQDGVNALALADSEKIFLPLAQQRHATGRCGAPRWAAKWTARHKPRVLRAAIQASTNRLESGLTLLASIGATAPFVGLLGTVWGIYHALANVSSHGTVQIDKVAGPVGEALVMTAIWPDGGDSCRIGV
jgi:biopolymer transport protein ExbB